MGRNVLSSIISTVIFITLKIYEFETKHLRSRANINGFGPLWLVSDHSGWFQTTTVGLRPKSTIISAKPSTKKGKIIQLFEHMLTITSIRYLCFSSIRIQFSTYSRAGTRPNSMAYRSFKIDIPTSNPEKSTVSGQHQWFWTTLAGFRPLCWFQTTTVGLRPKSTIISTKPSTKKGKIIQLFEHMLTITR
ncbi:hypothetical protein C2G38_2143223 [Gigaspora rosea]|uniref:Uncharacterized protein n=1 Tax=Gigaspora rosea TaxID=44941 RepID=A0A397V883_9GLOM|nr:hypothetical protein C2G38_2143223 [Gigaspora rosea]